MREHLRAELVCTALLMAAQRQQPAKGLVAHSDRGSQYAAGLYRALLEGRGMQQSMGRKGCCYDNALASRACWPGFLRKRIDRSASSGELLPRTQGRARSSGTLRQPRGGPARAVRLSRGLLQSPAAPLGSRLSHARACRAAGRLTRCPLKRGTITSPTSCLTTRRCRASLRSGRSTASGAGPGLVARGGRLARPRPCGGGTFHSAALDGAVPLEELYLNADL